MRCLNPYTGTDPSATHTSGHPTLSVSLMSARVRDCFGMEPTLADREPRSERQQRRPSSKVCGSSQGLLDTGNVERKWQILTLLRRTACPEWMARVAGFPACMCTRKNDLSGASNLVSAKHMIRPRTSSCTAWLSDSNLTADFFFFKLYTQNAVLPIKHRSLAETEAPVFDTFSQASNGSLRSGVNHTKVLRTCGLNVASGQSVGAVRHSGVTMKGHSSEYVRSHPSVWSGLQHRVACWEWKIAPRSDETITRPLVE